MDEHDASALRSIAVIAVCVVVLVLGLSGIIAGHSAYTWKLLTEGGYQQTTIPGSTGTYWRNDKSEPPAR